MLVLTRKLMEKLYIGQDICITVVRLEGGQVRLGIDAPREVSIVRGELEARQPVVAVPARPDIASEAAGRIEPRRVAAISPRRVASRGIGSRGHGPSQ